MGPGVGVTPGHFQVLRRTCQSPKPQQHVVGPPCFPNPSPRQLHSAAHALWSATGSLWKREKLTHSFGFHTSSHFTEGETEAQLWAV